jgi:FkbM family methyltransferase
MNPDRIGPTPFEVDFFGYRYNGDLSIFLDWNVYMYGAYAMHELMLLRDLADVLKTMTPKLSFYDVGANVGHHTLFMSKHATTVTSFEPYEVVRAKANQKLSKNSVSNVTMFPYALGAEDQELEYAAPSGSNVGSGSFRASDEEGLKIPMKVFRGDTFFEEHNLPKIDILKMDVEGFESAVLQGLHDRLRSDRPVILTEISGPDRSGFGSLEGLTAALYDDFEIYGVKADRLGGTYSIKPCQFESDNYVLITPKELRPKLSHILPSI